MSQILHNKTILNKERMKKILALVALLLSIGSVVNAQESKDFRGVFNRVGANLSVGTEGIGVGVAAPLTKYL